MVLCHIQDTCLVEGLTPLQRFSQCILQPQLTGLDDFVIYPGHSLGGGLNYL